jgi:hypothetical protein
MQLERRQNRSARPVEALALLLDSARARLGARTLTLATSEGWLIAGSGDEQERVVDAGVEADAGRNAGEGIATWRMCVGQSEMVLTSQGRAMDPGLASAVRRILAA